MYILCFVWLVFVMPLCASVYLCLVVTCWERVILLVPFVVYNCEFVTFPLVSWVRCVTSDICTLTYYDAKPHRVSQRITGSWKMQFCALISLNTFATKRARL